MAKSKRTRTAAKATAHSVTTLELIDSLADLRDVQLSYELLGMLIEPVGEASVELDPACMAAMLRALNEAFARRMECARRAVEQIRR